MIKGKGANERNGCTRLKQKVLIILDWDQNPQKVGIFRVSTAERRACAERGEHGGQ